MDSRVVKPESPLSDIIALYVAYKRGTGNKYVTEERQLRRLDALASKLGCPHNTLSKTLVDEWTKKQPHKKTLTQTKRANAIKQFALFLRERGYDAYVYPHKLERIENPYIPHIFTESEMGMLLSLADQYPSTTTSPYLGLTVPLVFRLLYGCGMRSSEVLNLRICDVDTNTGVLHIIKSKFGKSRSIPMASSLSFQCEEYMRLTKMPSNNDGDSFLRNPLRNKSYSDSRIYCWFRNLLAQAGIPHQGKSNGPRVHDIRHTFAVHRMNSWVLEGKDMRAMMPILSAYMGHCDLRGTQIYLRLTSDMFPNISKIMSDFLDNYDDKDLSDIGGIPL